MKKKQIAKLGLTLGLVGAIGVGGTLAILSQKTNAVVNTFAVGDGITAQDITIDETNVEAPNWDGKISDTDRDTANSYTITPGVSLVKDPQVHVKESAADCYVFINVYNVDEFIEELGKENVEMDGFGANGRWVKLNSTEEGYDGVYYYRAEKEAATGGTKVSVDDKFDSPKVFTGITLKKDAEVYEADGTGKTNIPKIQVKAAAVQATGLTSSWTDATSLMSTFNWGTWQ